MKKPFLSLKTKKEKRSLALSLCLCIAVLAMFFLPQKSLPVFSQNGNAHAASSLFELVSEWC